MNQRVAVIDYGMGNLHSVARAVEHVAPAGTVVTVSDRPADIEAADRIVFPGQGAIRDCMRALTEHRLLDIVTESMRRKPFLGICLGLQALLEGSDESQQTAGLGLYAGRVRRFPGTDLDPLSGLRLKIPHMGWNRVWRTRPHPLWDGIEDGARFYFVHSYYADPVDRERVAAETDYGVRFCCALADGPLFATQFHPEKSQHAGLRLLANFLRWDGVV